MEMIMEPHLTRMKATAIRFFFTAEDAGDGNCKRGFCLKPNSIPCAGFEAIPGLRLPRLLFLRVLCGKHALPFILLLDLVP
jgi:hypothetical protein